MIALNGITLRYGKKTLFDSLSAHISAADRIGLAGANGAGKSTLLRFIAGQVECDGGSMDKAKYVSIGYLPQDGMAVSGRTLYKEAETAFGEIVRMQKNLEEAQWALGTLLPESVEYQDALTVMGELQHRLEDLDAFAMRSKIEKVLMGLGFSVRDMERMTDEFSGGWQMRIALAKLLLQEPSLLLLDEPTNHLDLDSLQWLEEYLRVYDGAVMIVSHDRRFLDSMTRRTWYLRNGTFEEYAGNYSFFEKERENRMGLLEQAMKNQQAKIKETERFIERFRYKATKARQVQSRIKQLEKLERIEVETDEEEIAFSFPPALPSGRGVLVLQNIAKSYGALKVFTDLNYAVERGDRVAVVGVNGAGKSTLVRILAGVESFDRGQRIIGHNAVVSYFAQHQAEELDPSLDALQVLEQVATGEIRKRLRTILGSFLFHGDDVFKKVSILSGGEKSRLALAKMLLQPANLLIMDEPTNHLDMRSKTMLQEALMEYEGSVVIVSHDRDFLEPIANKVVEVGIDRIRVLLGTVSEYIEKKKKEAEQGRQAIAQTDLRNGQTLSDKDRKRIEAELRQERSNRLKPLRNRLSVVEKQISALEARKNNLENQMADPLFFQDPERGRKTPLEYNELKKELETMYLEWGALSEEIERS